MFDRISIVDVNDEAPEFEKLPDACVMVTEFHEPGDTVYIIKAMDLDDPNTPNGWIGFSLLDGNDHGKIVILLKLLLLNPNTDY